MQTIHYPIRGRHLEDVVTQHTLDMLMTQMENWQQGPGVIGQLALHPCWGTVSVLDRRYQGETIIAFTIQSELVRRLYERTRDPKWRVLANSMASHLLYLQDPSGGFIHATAEFEPSFDTRGCPIHFFNPVLSLCDYYQWEYADKDIKSLIPGAIDRQWKWSVEHIWRIGNGRFHPLSHPGWCGVTNQDLTAIAAVATAAKLFGTWDRYEQYAKPALDVLLSPAYYYPEIGLFERGDGVNFAERTVYYGHVIRTLQRIWDCTGDQRVFDALDNVSGHLFDAVFTGEDGLYYLARGAKTDPKDKTKVLGWEYTGIAFEGYPELTQYMADWAKRHHDDKRMQIVEELHSTIAAYVFTDGNIPMAVFTENPLFSIVSNPSCATSSYWPLLVLDMLGDRVKSPHRVEIPAIHRSLRNMTWKQNGRLWTVEEDGVRKYGGFTRYPAGITIGPDEAPVWGNYDMVEACDVEEILDA